MIQFPEIAWLGWHTPARSAQMSAKFRQLRVAMWNTIAGTGLAVIALHDACPPPIQFDFRGIDSGFAPGLQRDDGL